MGRLLRRERGAVAVSARTGEGIDDLWARIDEVLPRHEVTVEVLLPYERGDLVASVHRDGEVLDERHCAEGTRLTARVPAALQARLAPYQQDRP